MRRLVILVALVSAILPAEFPVRAGSLSATDRSTLQKAAALCRRGEVALQRGDMARARHAFELSIRHFPDLPDAHIGLGHVAMRESNYAVALREYELARDAFASATEKLHEVRLQRYMDAQEEMRQLNETLLQMSVGRIQLTPQSLKMLELDVREAIRELSRIQPPSPQESHEIPASVYFYIGNAHYHMAHIPEAVEDWEVCVAKDPQFDIAYNNLALGYLRLDRAADARAALDKAVRSGVHVDPHFESEVDAALAGRGKMPGGVDEPYDLPGNPAPHPPLS